MGGQVARLPIREGDKVQKGDLLLELWNDDLKAELAFAESQAAAAEARAVEACLLKEQAAREEERLRKLHDDGAASLELAEQAKSHADVARAVCQAAEAQSRQSKSRIEVARAQIEKTRLAAPFDGVVAELNAELGEFVTPSPPGIPTLPAVDLIESGCLYIIAPIDEVDAAKVRLGQNVRVRLDSHGGRNFSGRLRRIAPYVLDREKQARTVDIEVEIENPAETALMLPGYSADVEVLLDARRDVLRVPTEAVLEGGKVLVLAGGRLEERAVRKGLSNWEFTEIIDGLHEGENVVLSLGREGVRAGVRAEAEREAAALTAER
jgi:HlyD family secretion protein